MRGAEQGHLLPTLILTSDARRPVCCLLPPILGILKRLLPTFHGQPFVNTSEDDTWLSISGQLVD